METHKVELGGITLHGYADMPDPFVGLAVTAVNGWRGLPGARGDGDPIPGGHGSYAATRVLREERSIEVRGASIAASERAAVAMLDALEAEVAGQPVMMRVHDADGVWWRMVEVETVQVVGAWNRDRVIFAIDAIAADPRRYRDPIMAGPVGLPSQVGGLVLPKAFPWDFGVSVRGVATVDNAGAIPIFPRITVQGSGDDLLVVGGARRLQFAAFDGTMVFDSKQRRAWLNGVDVTRSLLRREWPQVAAGERADFMFEATNPNPDTTLTVEYLIGAW